MDGRNPPSYDGGIAEKAGQKAIDNAESENSNASGYDLPIILQSQQPTFAGHGGDDDMSSDSG